MNELLSLNNRQTAMGYFKKIYMSAFMPRHTHTQKGETNERRRERQADRKTVENRLRIRESEKWGKHS